MMFIRGKREVWEAVLIAGLSAIVSGLVTWGFEEVKAQIARMKADSSPANTDETDEEK